MKNYLLVAGGRDGHEAGGQTIELYSIIGQYPNRGNTTTAGHSHTQRLLQKLKI